MKSDVLEIVKNISVWCFENHSKTFTCVFNLTGHVDWIEVELISGGYDTPRVRFDKTEVQLGESYTINELTVLFEDIKDFKEEHDAWFSEENLKKQEEDKKHQKIKRLKEQLERLES